MTKREMFEAIVNGTISDEIVAMAQSEIDKMDARNAKRSASPSKTAVANEPIKEKIVAWLETLYGVDGPKMASEVGEGVGISTSKASSLCRQLVQSGALTETEVKVKGKGVRKAYAIAHQ